MPRDTIGDRVTLALKHSGKDDARVAEASHLTPAWVSAVKNDRIKNPPLDKLRALARATGVPLSYLTEPTGMVPIEERPQQDALSAAEAAVLSADISDEHRQAALVMLRALLRDREPKRQQDGAAASGS